MSGAAGPGQLPAGYYEQYIEAARTHWWFKGREHVLLAIVSPQVTLDADALVVDVGSGPGGPTRRLFPTQRIVAADLSARVLESYSAANAVIVADAAHLPLKRGSVSAICAFDVLEHLERDDIALRGWWEALVAGGWLVATVPAYDALWSDSDTVDRHFRRYRLPELTARLRAAGFAIVRASYFNMLLLPGVAAAKWMARVARSGRRPDGRNHELDLRLPSWCERMLERTFRAESVWLRRRNLPAGGSIVVLARKGL